MTKQDTLQRLQSHIDYKVKLLRNTKIPKVFIDIQVEELKTLAACLTYLQEQE